MIKLRYNKEIIPCLGQDILNIGSEITIKNQKYYVYSKTIISNDLIIYDIVKSDNIQIINCEKEHEWIIEQIYGDYKIKIIGKIFFDNSLIQSSQYLNNSDLEGIWHVCNYEAANIEPLLVNYCNQIMVAYKCDSILFIPIDDNNSGTVNSDIFIRKHYNVYEGFWIYFDKQKGYDIWKYSVKTNFVDYHRANPHKHF